MNASNEKLTTIHPSTLVPKVINLKYNNIRKIENIPEGVEDLDLSNNQLRVIENLPLSLKILRVNYNLICTIKNIPPNLHTLYINGNRIKSFDSCHLGGIKHLYMDSNPLKTLPFMRGLLTLHVEHCNLRALPLLPPTLRELYMRNNSITIIKKLPSSLTSILFSSNPIRLIYLNGIPTSLHSRFTNYPKRVVKMRECETCGICRDKLKHQDKIIYCMYNCGIPVHHICFKGSRRNICVFCRTIMLTDNDNCYENDSFINDDSDTDISENTTESEYESEYSDS